MDQPTPSLLLDMVERELARSGAPSEILASILRAFEATVGTIHRFEPTTETLELAAAIGLPETVRKHVERVPVGKGMAGIAAQRRAPVQVCNLQTDDSGVVRPGARETAVAGSIALPMLVDGELRGTLGVGKSTPHEFDAEETRVLLAVATRLGQSLGTR
ncbi:MAG: GAF domain-containing protein [Planctomycetota bacterium]